MTGDPIDYALAYAGAGYRVFPAAIFKPEGEDRFVKAPRAKARGLVIPCADHADDTNLKRIKKCGTCQSNPGGHNAASSDPAVVRRLWSTGLARSAVGLLPPEGVLILDDDSRVFDDVWLDMPRVQTASGKSHYYFRLAEGQDELVSENLIVYAEPDGVVDIRVGDGKRYAFAPCGQRFYRKRNGMTLDPPRLPVLPDDVYQRLLTAPRRSGGGLGGPGGGKYLPGVHGLAVGLPADYDGDLATELLDDAGWTTEDGEAWTRPGGTQKSANLHQHDDIWWLHVRTTSDSVLLGDHYYTPSMLLCVFRHDGDIAQTYDYNMEIDNE